MRSRTPLWFKAGSALLVCGWLGASVITAADSPPGPADPQRSSRYSGSSRFGGSSGGTDRSSRGLGLDEQQMTLIREAVKDHGDELRKLDEQMRAAARELSEAILTDPLDEKLVREKAEAVGKIQVEQTVLRAKIFNPVVPTLKPEQKEMILNSPWGMSIIMGGGFGGSPGGPGGPPPSDSSRIHSHRSSTDPSVPPR